jgi:excisionase family DNA binding protein
MPVTPSSPTRAVAESIRVQLGTDALVLITPGPRSCAVVVASVPGYPAHLTDARTELDSESVKAGEVERIAYSVPETARALGLSRELIYDELWSNRLGSVKAGRRRIITRQQIDAWLVGLDGQRH